MPEITDLMPPTCGKRNQFQPVEQIVDDYLMRFPVGQAPPGLRAHLLGFGKALLWEAMFAFQAATAKGIEQAAHLMQDPDFYASAKDRRKREMERMQKRREADDAERTERRLCPSAEQIREQRGILERSIRHYEDCVAALKMQLSALPQESEAKLIRIGTVIPKRRNDGLSPRMAEPANSQSASRVGPVAGMDETRDRRNDANEKPL